LVMAIRVASRKMIIYSLVVLTISLQYQQNKVLLFLKSKFAKTQKLMVFTSHNSFGMKLSMKYMLNKILMESMILL
jgi:hypothetical protein